MQQVRGWRAAPRALVVAFVAGVFLGACGGGGGDGSPSPEPVITGNWQLALSVGSQTRSSAPIAASEVPTEQQVSQINTANVAQTFATNAFSAYTVTVNGSTATVTGPGTNFTLVINSIAVSNYQSCGSCGVGTKVSYDVNMNYTDSGTIDGGQVPNTTDSVKVTFTYTRTS